MLKEQIEKYIPINDQEKKDKEFMLKVFEDFDDVLTRENEYVHFTSSAFVVNKKVVSCTACDCYSPINPYLIQTEIMPSENFSSLKEELTGIAELLFNELDLVDGIITIQYIVRDGKPYVIETMRRCLGNRFLTPVTAVTGFNFHKALVMAELGMDCGELKA